MVGVSDLSGKFHPCGLALCPDESTKDFEFIFGSMKTVLEKLNVGIEYKPNILVADSADSITSGFKEVFGNEFTRVICWEHVKRAIDKRLIRIKNVSHRNELLADINLLQSCKVSQKFIVASNLFIQKWRNISAETDEFIDYFASEWLNKNNSWHFSASAFVPFTNNGLESAYNVIRTDYTFRERWPLARFLTVLENIITGFSRERDPLLESCKHFDSKASIEMSLWTESFQYLLSKPSVLFKDSENQLVFYIQVSNDKESNFTADFIKNLKNNSNILKWKTFSEFYESEYGVWIVKLDKSADSDTWKGNFFFYLQKYIFSAQFSYLKKLKF